MTRRAGAVLIGLIAGLLAVVPGTVPAWAGSLARTAPAQPGPPTGLMATAVSDSEIDLTWTPPSGDPAPIGYDVFVTTTQGQEGDSPVNGDQLVTDTAYPVQNLTFCTTYYFQVAAVDSDYLVGTYSEEVPASTCPTPSGSSGGGSSSSLAAPTGLKANAVSSSEIDLTWTPPSDDARADYNVFDSITQGQEQTNPAVNGQAIQDTSYQVTGLNSCQTYYFEVDSADSGGNNIASSEEESAETFCPTPLPAAAVATAASSGSSGGQSGDLLVLIFLAAGAGALLLWWRRRRRRRRRRAQQDAPDLQTAPASSVHAVAHTGPTSVVVIRPTGTDPTLTVRVESHKAPSITTIEEVPPR